MIFPSPVAGGRHTICDLGRCSVLVSHGVIFNCFFLLLFSLLDFNLWITEGKSSIRAGVAVEVLVKIQRILQQKRTSSSLSDI